MLQVIYIVLFAVLSILAIANLVRSLMSFAGESQRTGTTWQQTPQPTQTGPTPHPEMLDESGKFVQEKLLVMRSVSMEDVRSKLDELYESSPSASSKDGSDGQESA